MRSPESEIIKTIDTIRRPAGKKIIIIWLDMPGKLKKGLKIHLWDPKPKHRDANANRKAVLESSWIERTVDLSQNRSLCLYLNIFTRPSLAAQLFFFLLFSFLFYGIFCFLHFGLSLSGLGMSPGSITLCCRPVLCGCCCPCGPWSRSDPASAPPCRSPPSAGASCSQNQCSLVMITSANMFCDTNGAERLTTGQQVVH